MTSRWLHAGEAPVYGSEPLPLALGLAQARPSCSETHGPGCRQIIGLYGVEPSLFQSRDAQLSKHSLFT